MANESNDLDDDDKTEEPTDARIEEFRKRGQVAQSKEFFGAILFCIIGIYFLGQFSYFYEVFLNSFNFYFTYFQTPLAGLIISSDITQFFFLSLAHAFLPIGILVGGLAVIVSIVQTNGFLFNEEALKLEWNRINPAEGFKRLFSLRSVFEGFKAVLKFSILIVISVYFIRLFMLDMPTTLQGEFENILYLWQSHSAIFLLAIGLSVLLLAFLDFFYNRWELWNKMRMTRQEIKDELKNRELDPLVKGRLRKMQREISRRKMLTKVESATVVITNPTHYAVALKYEKGMTAPQLVAKGIDFLALKIIRIAKEKGITVVENRPLAQQIYKTMKIDQFIPRELYEAVAKVLSFVYRLKKKRSV